MNRLKKFKMKNLFLLAVILFMLPISFALAEELKIYPTGHVDSTIDLSYLNDNPPFFDKSFKDKASSLPANYDLRNLNRVSAVKDQSALGTCWAFTAIGAIESNYMTQKLKFLGDEPDLSELHLAWFSFKDPIAGNSFSIAHADKSILEQGGDIFTATALLTRMSGPVNETSMPYPPLNTDAKIADEVMKLQVGDKGPADYFPLALKIRERYDFGEINEQNRDTIKQMLIQNGAVSISFYVDQSKKFDKTSKYISSSNAYYCKKHGEKTNHEVLIVGWDDNFSRKNFETHKPKKNGAWLAKNSWGKYFGDGGYFWISYEQYIKEGVIYIVDRPEDEHYYGYDALGKIDSYGYGDNVPAYAANVFKANGNEIINSISFYTTDNNASYTAYIYNDLGKKKPSSPVSGDAVISVSGKIPIAGYHTIKLNKSVIVDKGHYFSVVIKITNPVYKSPIAIECKGSTSSNNAVVKSKESYFSNNMITWTDGTKLKDNKNKVVKSNACIKAFTFSVIPIDEKHFPDEKFRNWVSKNCDFDKDGYLSTKEISQIKSINVGKCNIVNLKGIEYFTAMKILSCSNNEMTKLDVSKCNALETLTCNNNKLTSLTLSKNTLLKYLECTHNQLINLNISKCNSLETLSCSYNQLTTLTLSNNISLKRLSCEYNQLKELNVSKCNALEELYCYNNQLQTLTLGDNILLEKIFCNNNQLTKLDISKCTALKSLECNDNKMKVLTIGDNIALKSLLCHNNKLTNLNVSKCIALEGLYCNDNQLKNLTLGNNTALKYFQCYNNQITKLNVSKCTSLKILVCYNNRLKTLTLGFNTALEELYCYNNQLTALNVSKCSTLVGLYCYENKIKTLTFGSNTALKYIRCYSNKITNLNVSKCTALNTLYCHDNKLKTITFGKNIALEYFSCDDNQLTKLDVSKCTSLISLSCSNNQLTTLKLGNNTAYSMFVYCINNKLTKIDASGCFNVHIVSDDGVIITWPSSNSNSSKSHSSQNIDTQTQNHSGHESSVFKTASLKISDDDILWQGTERDEDLVKVRANMPVTFIIGEWFKSDGTKANVSVDNIQILVDEKVVEGIEIFVHSEEKIFTLPAEFVHDDFKVSVKAKFAGNELESDELFISAEK